MGKRYRAPPFHRNATRGFTSFVRKHGKRKVASAPQNATPLACAPLNSSPLHSPPVNPPPLPSPALHASRMLLVQRSRRKKKNKTQAEQGKKQDEQKKHQRQQQQQQQQQQHLEEQELEEEEERRRRRKRRRRVGGGSGGRRRRRKRRRIAGGAGRLIGVQQIGSTLQFYPHALAFLRGAKEKRSCCTPAAAAGVLGSTTKEDELQKERNTGKLEEGNEEMELHDETNNAQEEAEKKK